MVSTNILKLKELLKDGWKIKSHELSLTAAKNQLKVRVVLEKEGNIDFVEAINDSEFFEYTQHFEKFQDGYGNYEFIYVDDIKGYKSKVEEQRGKGTVPNRPYKISIGETELSDAHLYYFRSPGPEPHGEHVGIAHFFVLLDKNPDFLRVDFRDEVTIEWSDNDQIAFRGFAHEAYVGENSATLLCYGGNRLLFQGMVTCEFVGVGGLDALYLIVVRTGLTPKFHGANQPLLILRDFNVIFPVGGLVIPCDFTVEQVKFTKDIAKLLTDQVRRAKTLSLAPWNTVSTYAVINVEAEHYLEALKKAEERAKRAIDWIQFRTDITLPSVIESGKIMPLSYNLRKSISKCFLIPYGLAIDQITSGAVFYLLNVQSGHDLVFKYNPNEFFEPLSSVWIKLEQIYKIDSESVQPLYEALSWLMQTFELESSIDNLLQLWIAMEFICSKEKVPEIARKSSINESIFSINQLNLPIDEKEAVIKNIQQVNNPSLMSKWDYLTKRLGIRLSQKEQELLARLRTERNNIEHGKHVGQITYEDIEKFRSILERAFLLTATQLINSRYGIPDLSQLFN